MLNDFCFNTNNKECILTIEYKDIIYATIPNENEQKKQDIMTLAKKLIIFFYENGYINIFANKIKLKKFSFVSLFQKNKKDIPPFYQSLEINNLDKVLESMLFYVTEPETECIISIVIALDNQIIDKIDDNMNVCDGALVIVPDYDAQYFSCFVGCNTKEEEILRTFVKKNI